MRSFAGRTALFLIVFASVPFLVSDRLTEIAHSHRQAVQIHAQDQGQIVAGAVSAHIRSTEGEIPARAQSLQKRVTELASSVPDLRVKVIYTPEGKSNRFYLAGHPDPGDTYFARDLEALKSAGLLSDRKCGSRDREESNTRVYVNPSGEREVATALSRVQPRGGGCWTILTAHANSDLAATLAGEFWSTSSGQAIILAYGFVGLIAVSMLLSARRDVRRFSERARRVRQKGSDARPFSELDAAPDLQGVASEFDALVGRLRNAALTVRQNAEDNAHAFKTPCAIISQAVEPLSQLAEQADSEEGLRAVRRVSSAVARLDDLVAGMRRIDEASASAMEPGHGPCDAGEIVSELVEDYEGYAAGQGVSLVSRIEKVADVAIDAEQFGVVVENLLENGIDFSPAGGTIMVTLQNQGEAARLTVMDEGPGMSDEMLGQATARYVSGRSGNANSGIGLWIVRQHVESADGALAISNGRDAGLQITVDLPRARRSKPEWRARQELNLQPSA